MIFARMPYKIDGIKVTLADPTLKQGDSLNYQVNMSFTGKCEPQTHIIRIRILNPSGFEIPYYSENLVLNGIKAEGRIALALNEIPGTYTVQAQELIRGERRKVTFAATKR